MKRFAIILAPLVALLVGFHLWHTPLGGPLTDEEIEAFITTQDEGGGADWSQDQAFIDFLREDDGRPFVMINLMEERVLAIYPDGFETDNVTGREAARSYGSSVLPLLLSRGSYPVARAERRQTVINSVGDTAGQFDSLAMVRYRSRRDLLDMISSDAFLAAEPHKWASLENTLVAPSKEAMSFQLIGYLPAFLLVLLAGGVGATLIRKR